MRLADATAEALAALDDAAVLSLHGRAHRVRADAGKAATDERIGKLLSMLDDRHGLLADDLRRRGLAFDCPAGDGFGVAKIETPAGALTRAALVGNALAVRVTERDHARVESGRARRLALPAGAASFFPPSGGVRFVLIAGDSARGWITLAPGEVVEPDEFDKWFAEHGVPHDEYRARFLSGRVYLAPVELYVPFVNAARVDWPEGIGAVAVPGVIRFAEAPVEKQARRVAVLAYVFDPDDRALLVRRRFPPLVWGPPGGFVEEGEPEDDAARRETLEETGVEMRSAFVARDLSDLGEEDLWAVVGRAARGIVPTLSREVREAQWVPLDDLADFSPISPGRGSFRRSLSDLRAFEAAGAAERVAEIGTKDVAPALLSTLPDEALRGLAETLRDRAEPFLERGVTPEDLVNAARFLLDEAERRKLNIGFAGERDPLFVAAVRLSHKMLKDAGRPADPPPGVVHVERVGHLLAGLPETVVICPGFVSLTGSYVYSRDGTHAPSDVDIVYRIADPAALPGGSGACLKLGRAVEALTGLPAQHIAEPTGSDWTHVPVYDLALLRRPAVESVVVREDFNRFLKAGLETAPWRIRPGIPFEVYKAGAEFYTAQPVSDVLDWARPRLARGPVVVQMKADGFRMLVGRDGDRVTIHTEGGHDRAALFPEVVAWARAHPEREFILDTEFVPLRRGEPIPRQEGLAFAVGRAVPEELSARVYVHDAVWSGKGSLLKLPYLDRWREVERMIAGEPARAGRHTVERMPTEFADDEAELLSVAAQLARLGSAEGTMLKAGDFLYRPGSSVSDVAKLKVRVELSIRVIGWRKVPRGRPPGTRWTRAEALRKFPSLLRESRTYILRAAIYGRDGKTLVPVEAQKTLGPKDLAFDWDEERQEWTGGDDPKLWTACPGWPNRRRGELAYGNTFTLRWDDGPRCGAIVDIAPGQLQLWRTPDGREHIAWTFPKPVSVREDITEPGRLRDIVAAFARLRPAALAKELCGA